MYMHPRQEHIMSDWKKEALHGKNTLCGYSFIDSENTLHIYTDRPGMFIGKAGKLFDKYFKLLKESFQLTGDNLQRILIHEVVNVR